MTGQILDYKEINPESIVFEEPKKVKGGSYMTEIKYRTPSGEDVPFIIQTLNLSLMKELLEMIPALTVN